MHLEKLRLKNYKVFENIYISFKPGVNLLIGDNGVGKSTILDAIATALGGMFVRVDGVAVKNISKDDVRIEHKAIGDSSMEFIYHEPVEVECTMEIDGMIYSWSRIKEELSSAHTKTDNKDASSWLRKITNNSNSRLPILSYQSAARAWRIRRGDFGNELTKRLDDRRCGYIGCMDSSMDVKTIQQWCMKQELNALQKGKTISEYEMFKDVVASFMTKIEDLRERPQIYYSAQFNEFIYNNGSTDIFISKLSAGYQALLWMIMDLAYRIALLNPGMKDKSDIEGIVLIDEIDMHLHPKWQWRIIDALTYTFANVQFVVATHSPIVISSAKEARIIEIGYDHEVTYHPYSYGNSVEDILLFRQESDSRPIIIKKLVDEIESLLDDGDINGAENALEKLKGIIGTENSDYMHFLRSIEDEKLLREIIG